MAVGMANLPSIGVHDATARDIDGSTGLQQVNQFVTIKTAGLRDMVKKLERLSNACTSESVMKAAARKGARIVGLRYKRKASAHIATGNLVASFDEQERVYRNTDRSVAVVRVVGPRQTGATASKEGAESGNHAWLLEFGSQPRRPGTEGRRTYVNIHQRINGRMRLHPGKSMNDEQFQNAGRGYYFLMGSLRERGPGTKYSRDFAGPGPRGDGRPQHPITLKPGETIAPMPAYHLMENTIQETGMDAFNAMRAHLVNAINARLN